MDPFLGVVDRLVLTFLTRHTLQYGDLIPCNDGSVKMHPQLARVIVAACRVPSEDIDSLVGWIKYTLLDPTSGGLK